MSTARRRKLPSARELAQELAVRAFIFLAADADRARRFAAATGLCPEHLRTAAETPDFLAGVLDYFAADESLLLSFAANCSIDPADVRRARACLSPSAEE
ncbi:MAG: DUF3572 family protein [Methylovirgula sp.]